MVLTSLRAENGRWHMRPVRPINALTSTEKKLKCYEHFPSPFFPVAIRTIAMRYISSNDTSSTTTLRLKFLSNYHFVKKSLRRMQFRRIRHFVDFYRAQVRQKYFLNADFPIGPLAILFCKPYHTSYAVLFLLRYCSTARSAG